MTPDPPVASAAALDGLTVIDLSPTRVGAQVSQVLADFGADVLWIEPPGGSALRDQPAFPFFARGKQSIELDLKQRADRDTLLGLARDADVLIETFRPGVADRLGLGFERLAADNPRIVYASITGFGRTGPYAAVKGYEGLVMAKLGVNAAFRAMTRGVTTPVRRHSLVLVLGIADGAPRHPRGAVRTRAQRARPTRRSEPGPGLRRARHVGMVPPPDRRAVARGVRGRRGLRRRRRAGEPVPVHAAESAHQGRPMAAVRPGTTAPLRRARCGRSASSGC